jgi:hypothetical protein
MRLDDRTLVHVDAEAQMSTYDDEGKTRSSLSLIQRRSTSLPCYQHIDSPQEALTSSRGQRMPMQPSQKLKSSRLLLLKWKTTAQLEFWTVHHVYTNLGVGRGIGARYIATDGGPRFDITTLLCHDLGFLHDVFLFDSIVLKSRNDYCV